jgi:hypothetical protein
MFVGSNDYIYTDQKRSTDSGQTWTNYSAGEFVYSVAENSAGHLFFGTNSYGQGIYRSIDYGDTWELINNGFPSPVIDINTLAVDSEDYLYAGTNGKSVFKTTTSTVVSVDEVEFTPSSFILEQNYPNPFNNITEISWNVDKAGHVVLKVFDFTGREMETLVDSYLENGEHKAKFYANKLPAGVYFYQIGLNELVETRKMVLLQ